MNEKMSKKLNMIIICAFLIFTLLPIAQPPVHAADLVLSTTTTADAEVVVLQIDKVEKLAGMKLAIDYPARFLEYKAAQKGPSFNAFMQVINDKKPGRIIMVMASATGVSGDNLKIFELTFTKIVTDMPASLKIEPTECQLMSESLQEIPCNTSPLSISLSK